MLISLEIGNALGIAPFLERIVQYAPQEQDKSAGPPEISNDSVSVHTGEGSKLSRGLAKMGIKVSKFFRK